MAEMGPVLTGVPWYRRAGIWFGIGINPGSITIGGGVASQVPLFYLLFLIPLAALTLTALAVTQGIVGRRRREPLARRAASTFGMGLGFGLLNLLMAFGMIGWSSFYAGLGGFSVADILDIPGWLGTLIIVSALFILAELGLNRWNALVWVTAVSALGVALVALIAVGARPTLEVTADGIGIGQVLWVVGSVIAYAILFSVRCSDFTWDLEADSDVIKVGLSMFIPMIISITIGAILYQTVGDWNLADILVRTDLARLGQLFLLVSIASPSLSGLHSGSLAIASLTPLTHRQSAAIICAVSFVLGATRFDYQLRPFLDLMGSVLLPALVVTLLAARLIQKPSKNAALTAWLVGAGVALIFKLQGQLVHIVVGAVVSAVVLLVLMRFGQESELVNG